MSIYKQDNKIKTNLSGEIFADSGNESNIILDVNLGVIQFHNRIAKSATDNKVSKILDSAQNIALIQGASANQPIYNYDGYLEMGVQKYIKSNKLMLWNGTEFYTSMWLKFSDTAENRMFVRCYDGDGLNYWQLFYDSSLKRIKMFFRTSSSIKVNHYLPAGSFPFDEFFHMSINLTPEGYLNYYINGVVKYYVATSPTELELTNTIQFGYNSASYGAFYIKNFTWQNEKKFTQESTLDTQVFTPKEPFIWLKRYKEDGEKVLFISSRYLKDANVGSDDKIETIYSEIGVSSLNQSNAALRPKVKNGIIGANGTEILVSDTLCTNFRTGDFHFSFWAMFTDTGIQCNILTYQNSITFLRNSSGVLQMYYYGDYKSAPQTILNNKWYHIAGVRKDSNIYFMVNGVIATIKPDTRDIPATGILQVNGGTTGSYRIDDILVSNDSLVDPRGYAVGDKVFLPPKRRSLRGFDAKTHPLANNLLTFSIDGKDTNSYPGSGTTVYDLSRFGTNAQMNGTLPFSSGAWSFNGVAANNIEAPNASQLILKNDFTIEVWLKTSNVIGAGEYPVIVGKRKNGSPNTYSYIISQGSSNEIKVIINTDIGVSLVGAGKAAINDGNWHYVVAQRRGERLSLFLDTVVYDTKTGVTGEIIEVDTPLQIGQWGGSNNYAYTGDISKVNISNFALDAKTIQDRYNYYKRDYGL